MAELTFNTEVRNKIGKEDSKKLRVKNFVPAVVYGKGMQPVHIAVSKSELLKLRRAHRNALITLKLEDEEKVVIIREFQKHPITHEYQHLDFHALSMDETIKVDVDLEYVGVPVGRKTGGIFTSMLDEVMVECLPRDIPEVIKVNIEGLETGDTLHVADIKLDGIDILTNKDVAICQVSEVRVAEEDLEDEATDEEGTEGEEGAEGAEDEASGASEAGSEG